MRSPLLALAMSLSQPAGDGDAVVALAWTRAGGDRDDPLSACVKADEPMAARIRQPDARLRRVLPRSIADRRPDAVRLGRIAEGGGETLDFDVRRLGLPAPSPGCKTRYDVSAPVMVDDHAYVEIGMNCGPLCGYGELLVLKREDGAWRVVRELMSWYS